MWPFSPAWNSEERADAQLRRLKRAFALISALVQKSPHNLSMVSPSSLRAALLATFFILTVLSVLPHQVVAGIDAELLKKAESGDVKAQWELGFSYERGIRGVPQDYQKALKWYTEAANQGYAYAQGMLGGMYDKGRGVPHDYQKAIQWYTKAVNQGYTHREIEQAMSNNAQFCDKFKLKDIKIFIYAVLLGAADAIWLPFLLLWQFGLFLHFCGVRVKQNWEGWTGKWVTSSGRYIRQATSAEVKAEIARRVGPPPSTNELTILSLQYWCGINSVISVGLLLFLTARGNLFFSGSLILPFAVVIANVLFSLFIIEIAKWSFWIALPGIVLRLAFGIFTFFCYLNDYVGFTGFRVTYVTGLATPYQPIIIAMLTVYVVLFGAYLFIKLNPELKRAS